MQSSSPAILMMVDKIMWIDYGLMRELEGDVGNILKI